MASPVEASDYDLDCAPWESQPTGRETATAWLYTPAAFASLIGFFGTAFAALAIYCVWARAQRVTHRSTHAAAAGPSARTRKPGGRHGQRAADGEDDEDGDGVRLLELRLNGAQRSHDGVHDANAAAAAAGEPVEEQQEGYTDASFGRAALALLCASSAALLLLQALLVPQVNKVLTCVTVTLQARRLALFNASGLFCVAWFSALSWVPLARLRNAFRVPCALDEAEVVQVSVREETDLQAAAAATSSASKQRRRWWQRGRRASEDAPPPPPRPTRRITLACPVMQNAVGAAYITVLGTRRVYDAARGRFVAPASEFQAPSLAQLQAHAADGGGLTNAQAAAALATLGGNEVEVPVARMLPALAEEFLQVFFVYQFACCQLWAVDHYMAYAYTLCASIIFTGVANVLLLRRTQVQLREMAAYDALVSVCRSGAWKRVNCRELVPGDVIRVEEGRVPCDAALLSGRPAVDESMLTGESLPVSKTPLPPAAPGVAYDCARHKRHTVFAGTSVLTAAGAAPVAVVTKTGLSMQKGQRLQTLMFPAPLELSYEAQARVILVALLAYSLITFGITVYFFKSASLSVSIMFGLESIATVIPPLLPLALAVGQTVASDRLRRKAVFCLSLPRIALAGMVDVMCFDKTGTLTREGLDFAGTHPVHTDPARGSPRVGALVADACSLPPLLCTAMACATSLSRLGTRLVGNEVDCKLFSATGWELEESAAHAEPVSADATPSVLLRSSCGRQRMEVLRRFEFDHGLQCMSAVARDVAGGGGDAATFDAHVFVKGSYERMRALASPGSVPPDYGAVTAALAKQGAYVLALGHRLVPGVTASEWRSWTRSEAERDVSLLGLLVFRNELKPDTPDALAALIAGGVACTMITGDNAFTGCCIARAAGLLEANAPVALADERVGDEDGGDDGCGDTLLAWRDVDSGQRISEAALLEQLRSGRGAAPGGGWCELALTGAAFAVLLRAGSADATSLLRHARVLARMSPDQKTAAVDVLKAAGLIVGMCGDGGNDCGALRAAHVGIALSEAEASLVSPFASKRRTIAAVVDVLMEGRASLATSFASLKYMVQYGLLYSVLNLCVNWYQGSLSQAQYIFIDMAIILPLSAVSTLAGPARMLHARRPTTDLLGPHTLLSLLGQLALCAAFTGGALALLQRQPWYVRRPPTLADPSRWWLAPDSAEVTVLFLTAVHQFSASAVAFSLGSVFRAGAHTNWPQCLVFACLELLFAALVLSSGGPAARWFHLVALPAALRVRLWLLLQLQTLAMLAWEKLLLDGPVASWGRAVWDRLSGYRRPSFLRLPALAAFVPPAE